LSSRVVRSLGGVGILAAAALVPFLVQGCIAFVCFEGDPCSNSTGMGGSTSSTGTGPTSTTSTTGTATTSVTTGTATTTSTGSGVTCPDAHNCGATGIDCLGGTCSPSAAGDSCVCGSVSADLGDTIGRVAVGGSKVFVPVKGMGSPVIESLSTTFDPSAPSVVALNAGIHDVNGFIAAFSGGVAYSPATDPHLIVCNDTMCGTSPTAYGTHVNGVAFALNALYFAVPYDPVGNSNGVGSFSPFSVPLPTGNANGLLLLNDSPEGAIHTLRIYNNDAYWTDYDGCLRAFEKTSGASVNCLALSVSNLHAADLAVGPLGIFVAQTTGQELYKVTADVTAGTGLADTITDSKNATILATAPIAADSKWLYVSGVNEIRVYTYAMMGGSPLLVTLPTQGAVVGMNADDPKYFFYTVGTKLFRWTKP